MSRFTARPVVDMTGIQGLYDFRLLFAPEINDSPLIVPPASDGVAIDSRLYDVCESAPGDLRGPADRRRHLRRRDFDCQWRVKQWCLHCGRYLPDDFVGKIPQGRS